MSHSGNPIGEVGLDSLTDQLRDSSCSLEANKPDFRELDLGSPVSPLRTRGLNTTTTTTTTTTTSSSSSSSGSASGTRNGPHPVLKSNHSGELSETTSIRTPKPSSRSDPLIYSGSGSQSSVNSPAPMNVLPTGNICPSGKILKTGMGMGHRSSKSDVLGSGTGRMLDPEEVKKAGNEMYKKGNFGEALVLYDRAIGMVPGNAAYRSNRAAALMGLGRVAEAVKECEEAVRLDPNYWRAHQRLGSLFNRLGQVENARRHLYIPGHHTDHFELQKLQLIEKHLNKCSDARKVNDWRNALREADAAITAGADYSPQLFICRAEALLKLHQLEDAESCLSNIPKLEPYTNSCSQSKFFGMLSEAYSFLVRAQIEMALGRFENALTAAEKAAHIDPRNVEVAVLLNNVRLVTRARARGNDLFKSERFTEACSAYGEGLRLDPSNSVLYCNRAACWFKLGVWERSIDDCNQALRIQPNYTKALLRRAASNSKLERWADAVRDYEVLRKELPDDNEVAESLFHAQVALKKSRGEEVYNMKFGGEVEEILGLEQFRAAISLPGVSVVHFKSSSNLHCKQISPFVDALCGRYPSINFLKVDIGNSPAVANAENIRIVPTFKIYKNGSRVKEIVCPSHDMLEHSVRHYSF
ncbi:Small glutamine-rich tetratricopeptide repeat-containing protein A, putative [Ricinus communis]|uniref:Small glutamine-rich tetratricopeptide repeat-containing protein A, putative n=1 Tax=Ricinus communis TaxID=3988 RepID=B9SE65_RICCO|nr:Small glutamine-rich tetratricopeptide repeat-containing protein A, putative [Ricinus communis]